MCYTLEQLQACHKQLALHQAPTWHLQHTLSVMHTTGESPPIARAATCYVRSANSLGRCTAMHVMLLSWTNSPSLAISSSAQHTHIRTCQHEQASL